MWSNITEWTESEFRLDFEDLAKKYNSEDELKEQMVDTVYYSVFSSFGEPNVQLNSCVQEVIEYALQDIDFDYLANVYWSEELERRNKEIEE